MQGALRDVPDKLRPGDRVLIIGSLVLDTDHGFWAEIHPAWEIVILGGIRGPHNYPVSALPLSHS